MLLETFCALCNEPVIVLLTPSGCFVPVNPYDATKDKPVRHSETCTEYVRPVGPLLVSPDGKRTMKPAELFA